MLDGENLVRRQSASASDLVMQEIQSPSVEWKQRIEASKLTAGCLMQKLIELESSRKSQESSEFLSNVSKVIRRRYDRFVSNLVRGRSESFPQLDFDVAHEFSDFSIDDSQESPRRSIKSLQEILGERDTFPWNEVKQIGNSQIQEMLIELQFACERQLSHRPLLVLDILHFAIRISHLIEEEDEQLNNEALTFFGQLLYLVDCSPKKIVSLFDKANPPAIVTFVKTEFSKVLTKICAHFEEQYDCHLKTGLQSPQVCLATQIPIAIARLLLTKNGTVNFGIIDTLIKVFVSEKDNTQERQLKYALSLLKKSLRLRKDIENLKEPKSSALPINGVIRSALNLSRTTPITANISKMALLVALMSEIWQEDQISCFASALVKEIQSCHLIFSIRDWRELLEKSQNHRTFQGRRKGIPFIKKIYDKDLEKWILITKKGKFRDSTHYTQPLWKAPGIVAVCNYFGFKDTKSVIKSVLEQFPFSYSQYSQVPIKGILKKICEMAQHQLGLSDPLSELVNEAYFTFTSQRVQPLLKIYNNSIANMAEIEESGVIKKNLLKSIQSVIARKFYQENIPPTDFTAFFFMTLKRFLSEATELQFHPSIERKDSFGNIEGGFLLHSDGNTLHSSGLFHAFICNKMLFFIDKLSKIQSIDSKNLELALVSEKLIPYLNSTRFLNELVLEIHPSNKRHYREKDLDLPLPYEKMSFTPWMSTMGNDSKKVLSVFFEDQQAIQQEEVVFTSSFDALKFMIDRCKQLTEKEKRQLRQFPRKLEPICITGKHRFSFIPGHPSLQRAWLDPRETSEWIMACVVDPGKKIADSIIPIGMKNKILEYLEAILLPSLFSTQTIQTILEVLKQKYGKISIKRFRNVVINCVGERRKEGKIKVDIRQFARDVDMFLVNALPDRLKNDLEQTIVHVANTGWVEELDKIHFSFFVNPGSGELEMWMIQENGHNPVALNQQLCLTDQTWEFLKIDEVFFPNDD